MPQYSYENISNEESQTLHNSSFKHNYGWFNSFFVIIALLLAVFEVFDMHQMRSEYNMKLKDLSDTISLLQNHINTLEDNSTTINILGELNELNIEVKDIHDRLSTKIESVELKVNQSLSKAVVELDYTVQAAEDKINSKVMEVKQNLDVYITVTNQELSAESRFMKYQIGGIFTLLACLISSWHMLAHLRHINKPSVQRRILAILLMVPIYGITSWLSLVFSSLEPGLGMFRDCYEAYAVYTFVALLVEILSDGRGFHAAVNVLTKHQLLYLEQERRNQPNTSDVRVAIRENIPISSASHSGMVEMQMQYGANINQKVFGMSTYSPITSITSVENYNEGVEQGVVDVEEARGSTTYSGDSTQDNLQRGSLQALRPPCWCVCFFDENNPMSVAAAVLDQCQVMALQFVLLKPLLAIIPFILESSGVPYDSHHAIRDDHTIDLSAPKIYVNLILNLSVAVAFLGLVSFYHATEVELAWCDPWPKFLCIKGVVFMTFWQGIAISGLSRAGFVDSEAAAELQNILICIEMLLASVMHYLFFPYQEWEAGYKKTKERSLIHLRDTLALRDFVADMKSVMHRAAWEGVSQSAASNKQTNSYVNETSLDIDMNDELSKKNLEMVNIALDDVMNSINIKENEV